MNKYNKQQLEEKMQSLFNEAMGDYENECNTEESYEELLDEVYGDVEICGMTYSAGRALKELDPVAFNCGMSDEADKYYEIFQEENDIEDFRDEALEALNMEDENV